MDVFYRSPPQSLPVEFLPGLWLGDIDDAFAFDGLKVTVFELKRDAPPGAYHFPILGPIPPETVEEAMASKATLIAATDKLREFQQAGSKTMVHCYAGMERSPLTAAVFLVRFGYKKDLPEAYTYLQSIRPIVADRSVWVPEEMKAELGLLTAESFTPKVPDGSA